MSGVMIAEVKHARMPVWLARLVSLRAIAILRTPPRLISWEPAGRRVQQVPRQALPPGIVGASLTRQFIVPGEERVRPPVCQLSVVSIKCAAYQGVPMPDNISSQAIQAHLSAHILH